MWWLLQCGVATLVLAGTVAGAAPRAAGGGSLPDVILILLDDVGYGDLDPFRPGFDPNDPSTQSFIETPRMDALALGGMRFTRYHASGPVCSPTRAALLTGRYPQAFALRRSIPSFSERCVPLDVTLLAQLMRARGYVTGHFGKWHLGTSRDACLPQNRGYDEAATQIHVDGESYYDDEFILQDGTVLSDPQTHATELTTDLALDFIDRHAGDGAPLFLTVWYRAPHGPYGPVPAPWGDLYSTAPGPGQIEAPSQEAADYAALLSHADHELGRILDRVNVLRSTGRDFLILLTSDNGGVPKTHYDTNDGLRGFKKNVWEGGIRVPFVVDWPGTVPGGTRNDSVLTSIDLIPTLADLLGLDVSGLLLDGRSAAQVLLDNTLLDRPEALFWETKERISFFVSPTGEYNSYAVREGVWKLVHIPQLPPVIFDIDADPTETHDLSWDPAAAAKLADLESRYRDWRRAVGTIRHRIASLAGAVADQGYRLIFGEGSVLLEPDDRFAFNDADFTFQARVTPYLIGPGERTIVQQQGSWRLFLTPAGIVRLDVQGPPSGTTLSSMAALEAGSSHEIAFTVLGWRYDPSTIRLYIDGMEEQVTNEVDVVTTSSQPVQLGNDGALATPFVGELETPQFLLINRTASEVLDGDQDGVANAADSCPFARNPGQEDTDGDAIGDACQCGDVTGEGVVDVGDVVRMRRFVAGLSPELPRPEKANVTGAPGSCPEACTVQDAFALRLALIGLPGAVSPVCEPALP